MNESPTKQYRASVQIDFPAAMQAVIDGKKITKLEWGNEKEYGWLHDGFLKIHHAGQPDDKHDRWIISDGDLLGHDWVIIQ